MPVTAILAWGSLTWEPKTLEFHKAFGWKNDGPVLPIEFARISKNGRLTLVITENGTPITTYFTIANFHTTTDEAIQNLRKRESCNLVDIGFYITDSNTFYPENFLYKEEIKNWAKENKIKNVIWTNLPEKWQYKNENDETTFVNPDERIKYLKSLSGKKRKLAEEYIRKAPPQTKTKYRTLIEQELGWLPIEIDINPQFKEKHNLENKLTFSKMYGSGEIHCLDCNHKESVLSFIHGHDFDLGVRCATYGFQCQSCGKFHTVKHNMKDGYIDFQDCECGGKLDREKAVFCPNCKSYNLEHKLNWRT